MKKLMILFAMAIMSTIAMAQSETTRTIHGAVVDKNGNPLPGAVVSATEGAETTLVNSDGTFDLEIPIWLNSVTASYPGYKNKKMKPLFDQDMIFQLKKDKNYYGFLNASGGIVLSDGHATPNFGIMGGMLANVGFYLRASFSPYTFTDYIYTNYSAGNYIQRDGRDFGGTFTGGITKRLYKDIYAYLGIGYGSVICWDYGGGGYYDGNGMAYEGGLIFKIGRHFDITVGFTETTDFDDNNSILNFSLGYVFK